MWRCSIASPKTWSPISWPRLFLGHKTGVCLFASIPFTQGPTRWCCWVSSCTSLFSKVDFPWAEIWLRGEWPNPTCVITDEPLRPEWRSGLLDECWNHAGWMRRYSVWVIWYDSIVDDRSVYDSYGRFTFGFIFYYSIIFCKPQFSSLLVVLYYRV